MTVVRPRPAATAVAVRSLQDPAEADLAAVTALLRQSVPDTCAGLVPYHAAGFGAYLAAAVTPPAQRRTVFVRHVNAGRGVCAVADWRLLGTCLFLNGIAVDPRERGRGHGARLLDDGERMARRLGCDTLALDVSTTNAPARRLYERHGFVERTYTEWIDVPPAAADPAPDVRLLDWPAFSVHRSAYGFGDLRVAHGGRHVAVRVVGRALRVPADGDAAALAAALPDDVAVDRSFAIRPTSADTRPDGAFAHFARMARPLTTSRTQGENRHG